MAPVQGTFMLGPDDGTLQVKTYREGMASKAGHDLVLDVTRWQATLALTSDGAQSTLEVSADPSSLEVREGVGGVKPLTDKDRGEIAKNIDEKVLGRQPISFRSRTVELSDDGSRLSIEGELTMAGEASSVSGQLTVEPDGRVTGTIPLTQSEWGIKPYRGLMGALKVRDSLEIAFEGRLPQA